ncbi:hypothetical protein BDD12DRAFT_105262 [Trichophaea hybrida]|nr:hypothetical protein BDD12DRAFT_105262 [Trichophaea hybrida]
MAWVRDDLLTTIPQARIIRCSCAWRYFQPEELQNLALDMLQSLQDLRKSHEKRDRPILWISVGIGGIIIMHALSLIYEHYIYEKILTSTKPILLAGWFSSIADYDADIHRARVPFHIASHGHPRKTYPQMLGEMLQEFDTPRNLGNIEKVSRFQPYSREISELLNQNVDQHSTFEGYISHRDFIITRREKMDPCNRSTVVLRSYKTVNDHPYCVDEVPGKSPVRRWCCFR